MVDSLSEVDTSRAPEKPDLRPLPDEPPEDATDHGWQRGLRDWYWSVIRHWLHIWTDGAANYTDRYYEIGYSPLEILETRARDRALGFPSDEAREWFVAGLNAAIFTTGDEGQILMQGPDGLPDRFFDRALAFVVRRADRALELYGTETDSVDRDLSALDKEDGQEEAQGQPQESHEEPEADEQAAIEPGPEEAEDETEEDDSAPNPPPEQKSLF